MVAWLQSALLVIIPLGVFAVILLAPAGSIFRPVGVAARYSFLTTLLALGLTTFAVFNLRGWAGALASASLSLAAFALCLLGLWVSGQSTSTVLGGLLPLYDASNYYLDAQRLLLGDGFWQFSAWRPLFPATLALVLQLTGNHLMLTLAVFSQLAGIACYLFAREVQGTHGPIAAALTLVILFFYYRQRVSGMALSEHLGLAFGALGLAAIWHGAGQKTAGRFVFGIFLLSLGLNTRPGPFLILPALLIWDTFEQRDGRRVAWKRLAAGGLAVMAAFLINFWVVRLVAAQHSIPFSNFANTIYGLVHGGAHFYSAVADNPELNALQGSEKYQTIYRLAWEEFLRNPAGLVQGIASELGLFFSNSAYSVFSYIGGENARHTLAGRLALYALSAVGLVGCLACRAPHHRLLLAAVAGVLLSVPFVPPGDAYGLRLYAAGMPVIAALPALGLAFLLQRAGRRLPWLWQRPTPTPYEGMGAWGVTFAAMLALLVCAAPLLVILNAREPAMHPAFTCTSGQERLVVELHPGSVVNIHRESEMFLDRLPDFHRSRFVEQVHGMPDAALAEAFASLAAPASIYQVVDIPTGEPAWLLFDTQQLPQNQGLVGVCGRWEQAGPVASYHLFWPEQVTLLR